MTEDAGWPYKIRTRLETCANQSLKEFWENRASSESTKNTDTLTVKPDKVDISWEESSLDGW